MFVVEAADMKAITPGNLCKYADDTYIIIAASNSHTWTIELEHIDSWAKLNNLTLNRAKTVEVVFADKKSKRKLTATHRYLSLALHDALHSTFLES